MSRGSHRFPTSITQGRPEPTGYTRTIRTARFPVNTREREGSQDIRWGSEITRILHAVAGSNPVIPTGGLLAILIAKRPTNQKGTGFEPVPFVFRLFEDLATCSGGAAWCSVPGNAKRARFWGRVGLSWVCGVLAGVSPAGGVSRTERQVRMGAAATASVNGSRLVAIDCRMSRMRPESPDTCSNAPT